jgi:hypothetical protein
MELVAYGLRADYEGTTTVELADGSREDRPNFGGGLLAVGDGDFNVGEALEAGQGVIVLKGNDQRLRDLLDAYPPLKEVPVPSSPATIVSPYERRQTDDLHVLASLRGFEGRDRREKLIARLEQHDDALAAGDQKAADAIAAGQAPVAPEPENGREPAPVDTLTTAQLAAVLSNDTDTFADAGVTEVPAAQDELAHRALEGDDDARAALQAHGLEPGMTPTDTEA